MTRRKFGPGRGRGRPPLNVYGLPPAILNLKMPEDLRLRLRAAMKKDGTTASTMIRKALDKALPPAPPLPVPVLPKESVWPETDPCPVLRCHGLLAPEAVNPVVPDSKSHRIRSTAATGPGKL